MMTSHALVRRALRLHPDDQERGTARSQCKAFHTRGLRQQAEHHDQYLAVRLGHTVMTPRQSDEEASDDEESVEGDWYEIIVSTSNRKLLLPGRRRQLGEITSTFRESYRIDGTVFFSRGTTTRLIL
jgi:hypothetical protein